MSTPARLLLVDGHYYLYRSHFAIRGLSNSRGEPTNAIFGFTKALRKMIADVRPDRAAVVWDRGIPARRAELQPAYKQQRPPMPDDMKVQEGQMMALCPMLGVQSLSLPDTEADDLIASYCCQHDGEVVVATNDKDILQLVNHRVRIYSTSKVDVEAAQARNGGTSSTPDDLEGRKSKIETAFALLDEEAVRAKWGVDPARIGDVLALTGDTSDNIPGVPGVGSKTAVALINQFGSIDALLERTAEIASVKVREKIEAARQQILDNRAMVGLDLDLALPVEVEDLVIAPRYPELIAEIRRCEFRTLLAEIEREARAQGFEIAPVVAAPARPNVQGELF